MRQQFVLYRDSGLHNDNLGAETEEEVYSLLPWASEVIEVDGGWLAFESVKDAATWRNQR